MTHSGVSCCKKILYKNRNVTAEWSSETALPSLQSVDTSTLDSIYGDSRIFSSPMYCILQSLYKTNEFPFPSVNEIYEHSYVQREVRLINDHICSFYQNVMLAKNEIVTTFWWKKESKDIMSRGSCDDDIWNKCPLQWRTLAAMTAIGWAYHSNDDIWLNIPSNDDIPIVKFSQVARDFLFWLQWSQKRPLMT